MFPHDIINLLDGAPMPRPYNAAKMAIVLQAESALVLTLLKSSHGRAIIGFSGRLVSNQMPIGVSISIGSVTGAT
jgi:hypothetical protein